MISDDAERKRIDRAERLADEREQRAVDLAVKHAVEIAKTDGRLDEHQRHLTEINGNIHDMAIEQKRMNDHLIELANSQEKRDAVTEAVAKSMVSTRTFLLGLASTAVAIGALFVGVGHP